MHFMLIKGYWILPSPEFLHITPLDLLRNPVSARYLWVFSTQKCMGYRDRGSYGFSPAYQLGIHPKPMGYEGLWV